YCLITDLLYRKIYNHATITAILIGLGINAIYFGYSGLTNSLLGLAIGFFPFFIIFLLGGIGAGDVKLMAAIGALKGFPFIIWAIIYTALSGGIISIVVMIWYGTLLSTLRNIWRTFISAVLPWLVMEPLKKESTPFLPYGVAICVGTFWALFEEIYGVRGWLLGQ
ncbi:MAG: prepilin peptidase, partial [bacterium]